MFYSFPLNTRQIILLFVKETRYTYFVYNQSANVLRRNALSIRIIRAPINRALVRKGHMILILSSRMNIAKLTGSALPCVTTWKKSLRYSKRTLRDKLLSGFYRDVCLRVRVETERMFCHI